MRMSFDLHRCVLPLIVTIAALAVGPSAASAVECPNEVVRLESSVNTITTQPYDIGLPECRAYEQVTPPSKGGVQTSANIDEGGGTTNIATMALSGEAIVAITPAIWGEPSGYTQIADDPGTPAEYGLSRADIGWGVTPLNPAASSFVVAESRFTGEDEPGTGIWAAKTATESQNAGNLYVRSAAGAFTSIGPIAPESVTTGLPGSGTLGEALKESQVMGASTDLSHVLFASAAPNRATTGRVTKQSSASAGRSVRCTSTSVQVTPGRVPTYRRSSVSTTWARRSASAARCSETANSGRSAWPAPPTTR